MVAAGLKGIPESGTFRETFEFPVSLNVQGFAGGGLTAFVSGPQKTWQFLPALSKVVGTHNLKFGADIKVRHVLHDGAFATLLTTG